MIAVVLIAVALAAVAVVAGWVARGTLEEHRQQTERLRAERERQRVIHDTKRVSVARPGTRPGRVSKATIDMSASNMQQHSREV